MLALYTGITCYSTLLFQINEMATSMEKKMKNYLYELQEIFIEMFAQYAFSQ